jgi:hypothetical protein
MLSSTACFPDGAVGCQVKYAGRFRWTISAWLIGHGAFCDPANLESSVRLAAAPGFFLFLSDLFASSGFCGQKKISKTPFIRKSFHLWQYLAIRVSQN